MKLLCLFLLAVAAIGNSNLQAQDQIKDQGAGTNTGSGPAPDPEKTLAYIHAAWDTLTRSMTDCHTLVDTKITTKPVLYLPAELPAPEIPEMEDRVPVEVEESLLTHQAAAAVGEVHVDVVDSGLLHGPGVALGRSANAGFQYSQQGGQRSRTGKLNARYVRSGISHTELPITLFLTKRQALGEIT